MCLSCQITWKRLDGCIVSEEQFREKLMSLIHNESAFKQNLGDLQEQAGRIGLRVVGYRRDPTGDPQKDVQAIIDLYDENGEHKADIVLVLDIDEKSLVGAALSDPELMKKLIEGLGSDGIFYDSELLEKSPLNITGKGDQNVPKSHIDGIRKIVEEIEENLSKVGKKLDDTIVLYTQKVFAPHSPEAIEVLLNLDRYKGKTIEEVRGTKDGLQEIAYLQAYIEAVANFRTHRVSMPIGADNPGLMDKESSINTGVRPQDDLIAIANRIVANKLLKESPLRKKESVDVEQTLSQSGGIQVADIDVIRFYKNLGWDIVLATGSINKSIVDDLKYGFGAVIVNEKEVRESRQQANEQGVFYSPSAGHALDSNNDYEATNPIARILGEFSSGEGNILVGSALGEENYNASFDRVVQRFLRIMKARSIYKPVIIFENDGRILLIKDVRSGLAAREEISKKQYDELTGTGRQDKYLVLLGRSNARAISLSAIEGDRMVVLSDVKTTSHSIEQFFERVRGLYVMENGNWVLDTNQHVKKTLVALGAERMSYEAYVRLTVKNLEEQFRQADLETRLNFIENFKQFYIRTLIGLSPDNPDARQALQNLAVQFAETDSLLRHQNIDGRVLSVEEHLKEAFNRMIASLQSAFSEDGKVFNQLNPDVQEKVRNDILNLKVLDNFNFVKGQPYKRLIDVETPQDLLTTIQATDPESIPKYTAGYREGALAMSKDMPTDTPGLEVKTRVALNGKQRFQVLSIHNPNEEPVTETSHSITLLPNEVFVPNHIATSDVKGRIYAHQTALTDREHLDKTNAWGYDPQNPIAVVVQVDGKDKRANFVGKDTVTIETDPWEINGISIPLVLVYKLDKDGKTYYLMGKKINLPEGETINFAGNLTLARPWNGGAKGGDLILDNLLIPETGETLVGVLNGEDISYINNLFNYHADERGNEQEFEPIVLSTDNRTIVRPLAQLDENTNLTASYGLERTPTGEIGAALINIQGAVITSDTDEEPWVLVRGQVKIHPAVVNNPAVFRVFLTSGILDNTLSPEESAARLAMAVRDELVLGRPMKAVDIGRDTALSEIKALAERLAQNKGELNAEGARIALALVAPERIKEATATETTIKAFEALEKKAEIPQTQAEPANVRAAPNSNRFLAFLKRRLPGLMVGVFTLGVLMSGVGTTTKAFRAEAAYLPSGSYEQSIVPEKAIVPDKTVVPFSNNKPDDRQGPWNRPMSPFTGPVTPFVPTPPLPDKTPPGGPGSAGGAGGNPPSIFALASPTAPVMLFRNTGVEVGNTKAMVKEKGAARRATSPGILWLSLTSPVSQTGNAGYGENSKVAGSNGVVAKKYRFDGNAGSGLARALTARSEGSNEVSEASFVSPVVRVAEVGNGNTTYAVSAGATSEVGRRVVVARNIRSRAVAIGTVREVPVAFPARVVGDRTGEVKLENRANNGGAVGGVESAPKTAETIKGRNARSVRTAQNRFTPGSRSVPTETTNETRGSSIINSIASIFITPAEAAETLPIVPPSIEAGAVVQPQITEVQVQSQVPVATLTAQTQIPTIQPPVPESPVETIVPAADHVKYNFKPMPRTLTRGEFTLAVDVAKHYEHFVGYPYCDPVKGVNIGYGFQILTQCNKEDVSKNGTSQNVVIKELPLLALVPQDVLAGKRDLKIEEANQMFSPAATEPQAQGLIPGHQQTLL